MRTASEVDTPISSWRRLFNQLADFATLLNLVVGLIALIIPFATLKAGKKSAARNAVAMSSATVATAVVTVALNALADMYSGHYLLVVAPVTILAGLSGLLWWGLTQRSRV